MRGKKQPLLFPGWEIVKSNGSNGKIWRREGDAIPTRWAEGREPLRDAAGSSIWGAALRFSLSPAGLAFPKTDGNHNIA